LKNFRFIELYEESKLASLIPLFLAHVIQFIREAELAVLSDCCGEKETKRTESSEELIHSLRQTCIQLVQIVTFSTRPLYIMMSEPALMLDAEVEPTQLPLPVNWSLARQITAKLGQVFVSIVDTFVGREIEVHIIPATILSLKVEKTLFGWLMRIERPPRVSLRYRRDHRLKKKEKNRLLDSLG
jgi:hypothetical protein